MKWTEDKKIKAWLPRLQAHRGLWIKGLRQNSLESIQAAFHAGYQMVEFDVRLTKDLEVILFHDEAFEDEQINKFEFKKLLDRTPITRLEDLLKWLNAEQNKNLKLNIELKTTTIFNFTLEKKVLELIQKYNLQEQVLISSFNPFALARFRWLAPEIYRALIQTLERYSLNKWFIRARLINLLSAPHAFHLRSSDWSEAQFAKLAKRIPVVLWTVNDLNLYLQLKTKIHGVISDQITPELLKN